MDAPCGCFQPDPGGGGPIPPNATPPPNGDPCNDGIACGKSCPNGTAADCGTGIKPCVPGTNGNVCWSAQCCGQTGDTACPTGVSAEIQPNGDYFIYWEQQWGDIRYQLKVVDVAGGTAYDTRGPCYEADGHACAGQYACGTDAEGYRTPGFICPVSPSITGNYTSDGLGLPTNLPDRTGFSAGNKKWTIKKDWVTAGHTYRVELDGGNDVPGDQPECGIVTTTFTVPYSNPLPIGYQDTPGAGCWVRGWTCDASKYSTGLGVSIYDVTTGSEVGVATLTAADVNNNAAIDASCGDTDLHKFNWFVPLGSPLYDGTTHKITAKADDINSVPEETGRAALLAASGNPDSDTWQYLTCTPPAPTCTITPANSTTNLTDGTPYPFTVDVTSTTNVALKVYTDDTKTTLIKSYASITKDSDIQWHKDFPTDDTDFWLGSLYIEAEASNNGYDGSPNSPVTCSTTLTRTGTITGTVYDDHGVTPVADINGACQDQGNRAAVQNGSLTLSGLAGTFTVQADGTYSIPNVPLPGLALLTLTPTGDYLQSCPAGGGQLQAYAPSVGNDFYLSFLSDAWFQVSGGNITAESGAATAISSQIPTTTCSAPGCIPAVLRQNLAGDTYSTGYAVVGSGGGISTNALGDLGNLRQEDPTSSFAASARTAVKEDYAYFYTLYSLGSNPAGLANTNLSNLGNLQTSDLPANPERGAYYANGDVVISNPWSVASGQSYVIFVNGNLTIQANITVAEGGFLAFIVQNTAAANDIGFAKNVTAADGVYITDGLIMIASQGDPSAEELQFVGAGTFVGWGGVTLERDFKQSDDTAIKAKNNTIPVELFYTRPDFALNAPAKFKQARVSGWQEVEP